MQFEVMVCPQCGAPAKELAEVVSVQSPLILEEGAYEFEQSGSRICWDGQMPAEDPAGRGNLYCPNGHDWWTFPLDEQGQPILNATPPVVAGGSVHCSICHRETPASSAHPG